ncbi:hypothetical protein [Streptomyces sp. AC550_RSS872]|uniref:hypothetical protein n=1 Tax=Streptomyces sp. AC550_RSS872 TaxID=2823689 RepID=UPI001C25DE5E|nr:hypothetical protein [Streptomyces sp. AC550_RSS872]
MTDALERDARALLEEYDSGAWTPNAEDVRLAEGLARAHWDGSAFRAALRDIPEAALAGRLVDVLDPATAALESTDPSDARPALLALRQLMDALAAGEDSLLDQDG